MKIGILTYYNVHNHGAVLQANAMKKILEAKGHECGFLEFKRDYSNISQQQANKYTWGLGSIFFYAKYLREKGMHNILYNMKKKKILSTFRKNNLPLIAKSTEFTGDLIIIGSDEVFSLEVGVNPFMYGNNLKAKHIISYAGSFGPTNFNDIVNQGMQEMISNGFAKMDAISVRDNNSYEIVKKLTNVNPTLVCDPVILYGYEKEMILSKDEKPYILIYSYDKNLNDINEYKYINEYAQKYNLEVVSVGYYHDWCKSVNVSPEELLGWIKNAKLVITDTFHGSVMSIICNTPMIVKLRKNQNKLYFLLSEYGLLDRIIPEFTQIEHIANEHIDFNKVNKIILDKREMAMEFLDEQLIKYQG